MGLVFQGSRAVLGFPSFQQALGNLGLLCLPCVQENLEVDDDDDDDGGQTGERFSQALIICILRYVTLCYVTLRYVTFTFSESH